jgi:hypothetical protein
MQLTKYVPTPICKTSFKSLGLPPPLGSREGNSSNYRGEVKDPHTAHCDRLAVLAHNSTLPTGGANLAM